MELIKSVYHLDVIILYECITMAVAMGLVIKELINIHTPKLLLLIFLLFLVDWIVYQYTTKSALFLIVLTILFIVIDKKGCWIDAIYVTFSTMAILCVISMSVGQILYLIDSDILLHPGFSLFMSTQLIVCTYLFSKLTSLTLRKPLVMSKAGKKTFSLCLAFIIIPITSASPESNIIPFVLTSTVIGLFYGLYRLQFLFLEESSATRDIVDLKHKIILLDDLDALSPTEQVDNYINTLSICNLEETYQKLCKMIFIYIKEHGELIDLLISNTDNQMIIEVLYQPYDDESMIIFQSRMLDNLDISIQHFKTLQYHVVTLSFFIREEGSI